MPQLLPLDPDQLLTTTRCVRKRLDLATPVSLDLIREALTVALQAPTGANQQNWHWIIVTDLAKRKVMADLYAKSFATYIASGRAPHADPAREVTHGRVVSSARYLADHMADVPVLVIGAIDSGFEDFPARSKRAIGVRYCRPRGVSSSRCALAVSKAHGRPSIWNGSKRSPNCWASPAP